MRGDIHSVPLPFPSANPNSPYHSISSFPLVKLADFGSCRGIHSHLPYTEYIATRWYRSPECLLFDGIYSYKMDIWGIGCVFFELITKIPIFPGDDELDQLHKVHNVMGTPSERLLKVMVAACTQAIATSNSNSLEQKQVKRIFKRHYNFPPTKGCGLRAAFPPYILYGASRVPPKTAASLPGYNPNDYPGITDECVNLIELLLQYDPDARPSARQAMKHPWLKECRDAEAAEKHGLAINTVAATTSPTNPTSNTTHPVQATSPPPVQQPQPPAVEAASPTKVAAPSVAVPAVANNSNNSKVAAQPSNTTQAPSNTTSVDPMKALVKKRTKNREKAPAVGGMEPAPVANNTSSNNANNLLFNDANKKKTTEQASAVSPKKVVNNSAISSYAASASKYSEKTNSSTNATKVKEAVANNALSNSMNAGRKFTFKRTNPANQPTSTQNPVNTTSNTSAKSVQPSNPLSILIPSKLPAIASAQSAHVTSNNQQTVMGPMSALSDPGQQMSTTISPLQPSKNNAEKINLVEKAKNDANSTRRNSIPKSTVVPPADINVEVPHAPTNRPQTTKKLEPLELAPDANRPSENKNGLAEDLTVEKLRRRLSQQDLSNHANTSDAQYKVVSSTTKPQNSDGNRAHEQQPPPQNTDNSETKSHQSQVVS